jgi:hypothetical protein
MPGRNDPCPCGSGKKYKKCCLAKDQADGPKSPAFVPSRSANTRDSTSIRPRLPKLPLPPPPPDPHAERADRIWKQFESQSSEGRLAMFREALDDPEELPEDVIFEMLSTLHTDAVADGERTRFAECIETLRSRRPGVFAESSHFYLSWCIQDALVEGRQETVNALSRELAAQAGQQIDVFNRTLHVLEYHGQLPTLVEAHRIAWPGAKSSKDILSWGVSELAHNGADYEIYTYLESTSSPDPEDAGLRERIGFFLDKPDPDWFRDFISDLTGTSGRTWQVEDFALRPISRKRRDGWDDEEDRPQPPDHGAINLSRLLSEFVGYLRREEGIPFPRGELVRQELYRYFLRRHEGELDPQPSMLDRAMHPNRELPKPPPPAHPLCPERVTLDVHLGGLLGVFNTLYHSAAIVFETIPAWLRFLQARQFITADTRRQVANDLLPLHATLLKLWEQYGEDPSLYRNAQAWPADAAQEPEGRSIVKAVSDEGSSGV